MIAKLTSIAQAHGGLRAANDSMNGMPLEKPRHRIAVLADQCVQCGLCLPVCPTYALDGNEAESPRGRIAIAAALAQGMVAPTPALRAPLDHCLGCLNCQRVCPAAVQYEELLVETRALLGPLPVVIPDCGTISRATGRGRGMPPARSEIAGNTFYFPIAVAHWIKTVAAIDCLFFGFQTFVFRRREA